MLREIEVDMDVVHNESMELLRLQMDERKLDRNIAIAANAMTIGRLVVGPQGMTVEDEAAFVTALLGWASLYFTPVPAVVH